MTYWRQTGSLGGGAYGQVAEVRNYTQRYEYDEVGNILRMRHQAAGNSWTREYAYQAASNRLILIHMGANTYTHPHHQRHGYVMSMPHLQDLRWNFKEEFASSARQKRADAGTPETTYYQYDGEGRRIRKITENQAAAGTAPTLKEERIYLDGYELYTKHSGKASGLKRVSLSVMDEDHRFVTVETRNDIVDRTEKQLVRYQLHNRVGSASPELDGSDDACVISYEEYHPYGTTAYQARNTAIRSAAKRYRFTGMERDEESGLGVPRRPVLCALAGQMDFLRPASQRKPGRQAKAEGRRRGSGRRRCQEIILGFRQTCRPETAGLRRM